MVICGASLLRRLYRVGPGTRVDHLVLADQEEGRWCQTAEYLRR